MKPVAQVVTEPGRGDSLAACVASILETSLAEVGDLDTGNNLEQLEGFLALRGYGFCFAAGNLERFRLPDFAEPYCIVVGPSPRKPDLGHAVVALVREDKTGIDLVYDPHPDGAFVGEPWRGCLAIYRLEEMQKQMAESS